MCFLVLCNRHWFNRVPGANPGIAGLPSGALCQVFSAAGEGTTLEEEVGQENTGMRGGLEANLNYAAGKLAEPFTCMLLRKAASLSHDHAQFNVGMWLPLLLLNASRRKHNLF